MKATIPPELGNLLRLTRLVPSMFRQVSETLEEIGREAQQEWIAWASGTKKLPNGETISASTGEYARSIKFRRADSGGEIAVEVYSDSPIHEYLDKGTRERDMKAMLSRSQKAKTSKDGHRYMSIPFRHKVADKGSDISPGGKMLIPRKIANLVRKNEQRGTPTSRILSAFREHNQGRRASYGPRHNDTIGHDPQTGKPVGYGQRSKITGAGNYTWKSGLFSGLTHFAGFKGRHGQWLTFRTMSENSPAAAWMSPGTKPKRILEQVHQFVLASRFEERVGEAAKADIQAIISGE